MDETSDNNWENKASGNPKRRDESNYLGKAEKREVITKMFEIIDRIYKIASIDRQGLMQRARKETVGDPAGAAEAFALGVMLANMDAVKRHVELLKANSKKINSN